MSADPSTPRIRPIAVCVIRRGDDLLNLEGRDPATGEVFYRPAGGGIDFGEHSRDTVGREFREEFDLTITDLRLLGTIESIFEHNHRPGHEIVRIYEGRVSEPHVYERDHIAGMEGNGEPLLLVWRPLAWFRAGNAPLYPEGLLDLIDPLPSG